MPVDSNATEEVPAYEDSVPIPRSPALRTSHKFQTGIIELELTGSHAKTPQSLPMYYTPCSIGGVVRLRLPKSETIKSLMITIIGSMQNNSMTEAYRQGQDRNLKGIFWTVTKDALRTNASPQLPPGTLLSNGTHEFPFSFTVPEKFNAGENPDMMQPTNGSNPVYRLPSSFQQLGEPFALQYRIQVEAKRGIMKTQSPVTAQISVIPISKPETPMSNKRSEAYRLQLPLPLPDEDPDGYTSEKILIAGQLLHKDRVEIACELFLPRPAQFPIGSPLHAFLKLSYDEEHFTDKTSPRYALDILTAPSALKLVLVRITTREGIKNLNAHDLVNTVFWRRTEEKPRENNRWLQGEIALPNTLLPDFEIPKASMRYSLELRIGTTTGFIHSSQAAPKGTQMQTEALAVIPVQLTSTGRRDEPRAPSYAPAPRYGVAPQPSSLDYLRPGMHAIQGFL